MDQFSQATLWLQCIAILISSIFYLLYREKKGDQTYLTFARAGYWVFTVMTTIASALLMYYFLTNDFRFEYVIKYSSSDLPLHYLISSFWAGQEGSFLLWVLLGAWLGIILMYTVKKHESRVMLIYNLQLVFLSVLLIKQSPFVTVPNPFEEGMGLNMLLQDPWMVIHPPIVFLGYAAFAVPFSIAIASLWKRDYNWVDEGLPWVSFSFVTLGAGIIIGGVWSYKVLGWGGYWGWDPVENASLLPWLAGTALLHGMILQKSTGRLAKTNYALAAFSFVLIIYSTFLTRSGVLADFSVHSFVDLGITGWLVVFIGLFMAISVFMIIRRASDIPVPKENDREIPLLSREVGLVGAMLVLLASTVITGLGTSAPLITRVLEKASKVSTQFYVTTNLPIAVLIGLLLSYVPLLKWGKNDFDKIRSRMITGFALALVTAAITLINGFPGILTFLMVVFAGFTVGVNLELLVRLLKKSLTSATGAIVHLGVGLMFIGFVSSSVYDKSERISLPQGVQKEALGYQITLLEPTSKEAPKGTTLYLPIEVKKGNSIRLGQPDIFFEPPQGRGESKRFHHPYIQRGLISDLYVSPEGFDPGKKQHDEMSHYEVVKGNTITFGDYALTFTAFEMSNMGSQDAQHSMNIGARMRVSYKGGPEVELLPVYKIGIQGDPASRVKLPGQEAYIVLTGINADRRSVMIHYQGPQTEEGQPEEEAVPVMFAEVSTKPGMNILWLGVALLLLGGLISVVRRWPKTK